MKGGKLKILFHIFLWYFYLICDITGIYIRKIIKKYTVNLFKYFLFQNLLFYVCVSHFYINVLNSSLIKKYATIPKILPIVPAIFNNLSVVICNPNNRYACNS